MEGLESGEQPLLLRLLPEASRQLIEDWQVVRQGAASRGEVVFAPGGPTPALAAAAAGGTSLDLRDLSKSQPPRRLLSLLRGRVVRLASSLQPVPSSQALLNTLLSFESVSQQLE